MRFNSDFKNLVVWQKGMDLVTNAYKKVQSFPQEELFGLTSQIKRSSVSIPSNIAEGQARGSKKDFIHFLHYAKGSAAELETQILISMNVGLAKFEEMQSLLSDLRYVSILVSKLISSLESPKPQPNNPITQ